MTEKAFIYTVTEDVRLIKKVNAAIMISVVVTILTGVICSEGIYVPQHLPLGIPHPLTINREILQAQLNPKGVRYAVQEAPPKDVSYSLSYRDYLYLKRHKIEGQDSPFNPEPESGPTIAEIKGKHKSEPVKHDVPRLDPVLKRSAEIDSINGYDHIPSGTPVLPEVHKHIYFHVPPPDFEEPPPALILNEPAKKINILFIKVPSYEPSLYQQHLLQNLLAPIEDKTLIYVLSKKEDPEPPVLQLPKPSPPEVYFVKYNTPTDIEPINNEDSLTNILQNNLPLAKRKREDREP